MTALSADHQPVRSDRKASHPPQGRRGQGFPCNFLPAGGIILPMLRTESRLRWRARLPIRVILAVALLVTIALSAVLLVHAIRERDVALAALKSGGPSAEQALVEISSYLPGDRLIAAMILVIAAASGVLLALMIQAFVETRARLERLTIYATDILENLATGVVTLNDQGSVTAINTRALEFLAVEGAIGRPYEPLFLPYPALVQALQGLFAGGREFGQLEITRSTGERGRILRITGDRLRNPSGKPLGAILLVADVTEVKEYEQDIRRTERLAGLGTLAAAVAHEIRNPLGAMAINLQLLEESLEEAQAAEKTRRYLGVVLSETQRLNAIVENFIRFAKPRSLEREWTRIQDVLDAILSLVQSECDKRRIRIVREEAAGPVPPLCVDAAQMQQALLNILINAIQAMPAGGTLTVRTALDPAFVRLDVIDTGPGIPPGDVEKIFDLYYTTKKSGLGLGLPIAQKILSEHKGYVKVRSRPGETCFSIGLPVASPSRDPHDHASLPAAHR